MLLIRRFEEKLYFLFSTRDMPGSMHQYNGQEAVAVGVCAHLERTDYITSTHRGHGHCIAMGGDVNRMLAEIVGKETGYCKGKGGSMHIADLDLGIIGANGIVGGGIPIAVGAGIAMQGLGRKSVVVCFFGDGASNTGSFHESVNMASIWKVPVIFLCENNLYGISGCVKDTMNICDISVRAQAYGIPGYTVDGNDVLKVYGLVKEVRESAAAGKGPVLIEAKTYRWLGHWQADPCRYRDESEVNDWKKKCPIDRMKKHLLEARIATDKQIAEMEENAKRVIDESERFAVGSPDPDPEEALEDIYA
jgi:TPP-dependent pyruvate/acetoin dehydrogenase alpha subunit